MNYYWIGGGSLFLAAAGYFLLRGKKDVPVEPVQSAPSTQSGMPLPFYSAGGVGGITSQPGQAGSNLPLGGEVWQDQIIPLSENPDVEIAKINAGIAQAQIDASREVAMETINKTIVQPVANAVSNVVDTVKNEISSPQVLDNIQYSIPVSVQPNVPAYTPPPAPANPQNIYIPPAPANPQNIYIPPAIAQAPVVSTPAPVAKTASQADVVAWFQQKLAQPESLSVAVVHEAYNLAKQHGLSAYDVGQGLNIASNTNQFTPDRINRELAIAGLPGL